MKPLLCIAILLFSLSARADEVVNVVWDIIGVADSQLNLASGTFGVDEIRLDTRWSTYGAANGVIILSNGAAGAATGSCFFVVGGVLTCELVIRQLQYRLVLDDQTGSGELIIADEFGVTLEEGAAILQSAG